MADAKLEVKIGAITFTGEGTEKWLAEQLEVIIKAAPKLSVFARIVLSSALYHATWDWDCWCLTKP